MFLILKLAVLKSTTVVHIWNDTSIAIKDLRENVQIQRYFWSAFSRIRTEYGEIHRISLYSVRMRENTDQK